MQIVNAMKVKDRNHRSFGQLVDGIKGVLNARQFWQIDHLNREINVVVAHTLVKVAMHRIYIDQVWIEEIINFVYDNVFLEQHAFP